MGALVAGARGSRDRELPVGDHQSSPSRRRVAGVPAFVAAKIATPSGGLALIRPGVLAKLAEGAERRLLIVRAPAGYGKTVVVAEASRRLGWRAAWYRLDVLDHDPAVLIASLVQTIREPVPGFGAILLERFAEAHEVPMSPSEMTALLVSELRDEVDGELHIVIDDYHQAIASTELNRTLDYLLANLPSNVHLVLLTRYQPTIATTRLKLDDQIIEVSFEDLRLDAAQIVELFAARSRPGLAHGQAQRLAGLTEGWPASLVLISRALSWTNLGSIEHALVDPRLTSDVFSYLSEEAFRREDAETVAFLLATCCLESMTVELADKVARTDHAQRSLERLVAHNVFTFVDRATGTYRYHSSCATTCASGTPTNTGRERFATFRSIPPERSKTQATPRRRSSSISPPTSRARPLPWCRAAASSSPTTAASTHCAPGSTVWLRTRRTTTRGSCSCGDSWRCARATRRRLSTP